MSDQAIDVWITRWVLNSTCGKILKARGWPMAGKPGGLVVQSGPGLMHGQIILGDWFDNEAAARKDARKEVADNLKTSRMSVERLEALLESIDEPDMVVEALPPTMPTHLIKHAAE